MGLIMKKEGVLFNLLLCSLFWIKWRALLVDAKRVTAPTPAPWFQSRPLTTTADAAPKKHKKTKMVKKRRHNKNQHEGATRMEGQLADDAKSSLDQSQDKPEEGAHSKERQDVDEETDERTRKKKRRVKVRRRTHHEQDVSERPAKPTSDISPRDEELPESGHQAPAVSDDRKEPQRRRRKVRVKRRRTVETSQSTMAASADDLPLPQVREEPAEIRVTADQTPAPAEATTVTDGATESISQPVDEQSTESAESEQTIQVEEATVEMLIEEAALVDAPADDVTADVNEDNNDAEPTSPAEYGVAKDTFTEEASVTVSEDFKETVSATSDEGESDESKSGVEIERESYESSGSTSSLDGHDETKPSDEEVNVIDGIVGSPDDESTADAGDQDSVADTGNVEVQGAPSTGMNDGEDAAAKVHEIFEREVVKVKEDYIPNLAEFDTGASEESTFEEEALSSVTSEPNVMTKQSDSSQDAISRGESQNGASAVDDAETHQISEAQRTASKNASQNENAEGADSSEQMTSIHRDMSTGSQSTVELDFGNKDESASEQDETRDDKAVGGDKSDNAASKASSEESMVSTLPPADHAENVRRVVVEFNDLEEKEDDDSDITVSLVTWNLAEASPTEDEASFIRRFRDSSKTGKSGSDIVLVSGQECENVKPRRAEGHRSREFRRLMIKMLGRNYVPLAIHSLGGVQCGIFCKRSILGDVESVSIADVACGIGNVFHNKGAIAAFIQMRARERKADPSSSDEAEKPRQPRDKSLRMLFISAHMAAHVKHIEARNMDYWRIASELEAEAPPRFLPPRSPAESPEEGSGSHLMDSIDRVFFCGDLNYRVDLPREAAENRVNDLRAESGVGPDDIATCENREKLILHDQLLQTIAEGQAFPGFAEGKIAFAPTFKFDKGTNEYDTSHKQRIPAWTDRVLFKPVGVRVLDYSSVSDATHSDHRPVYASFRVSMQGRELPAKQRSRRRRRTRQAQSKEDGTS